eukprot:scaffold2671_cov252-Pinguiococcus_pyrenoidosus.AAC.20
MVVQARIVSLGMHDQVLLGISVSLHQPAQRPLHHGRRVKHPEWISKRGKLQTLESAVHIRRKAAPHEQDRRTIRELRRPQRRDWDHFAEEPLAHPELSDPEQQEDSPPPGSHESSSCADVLQSASQRPPDRRTPPLIAGVGQRVPWQQKRPGRHVARASPRKDASDPVCTPAGLPSLAADTPAGRIYPARYLLPEIDQPSPHQVRQVFTLERPLPQLRNESSSRCRPVSPGRAPTRLRRTSSMPNDAEPRLTDTVITVLSGAGSGTLATVAKQPIQRIKWIRQVSLRSDGAESSYRGIVQQTVRRDGLRGFFRGSLGSIVRNVPHSVLVYSIYPHAEDVVLEMSRGQHAKEQTSFAVRFWAGYITLFSATLVTHPLDTLRVRSAVNKGETRGAGAHLLLQLLPSDLLADLFAHAAASAQTPSVAFCAKRDE